MSRVINQITVFLIIVYTIVLLIISILLFQVAHLYGIDYDGPYLTEEFNGTDSYDEIASVVVPETEVSLTELVYQELTQTINPLGNSDVYGVDIYLQVLEFLNQ